MLIYRPSPGWTNPSGSEKAVGTLMRRNNALVVLPTLRNPFSGNIWRQGYSVRSNSSARCVIIEEFPLVDAHLLNSDFWMARPHLSARPRLTVDHSDLMRPCKNRKPVY